MSPTLHNKARSIHSADSLWVPNPEEWWADAEGRSYKVGFKPLVKTRRKTYRIQ